jgi:hypothetical protein
VLESPVRMWFWFFPWKLGRYSILNEISAFDDDSFDLLELRTRYHTLNELIWRQTREVFKEFDLLTEEIERIIVNNFFSAQQMNIGSNQTNNLVSGSPGARISQMGSVKA